MLANLHCPRRQYPSQEALDECYMQIALDFAIDVISRYPIEVYCCDACDFHLFRNTILSCYTMRRIQYFGVKKLASSCTTNLHMCLL